MSLRPRLIAGGLHQDERGRVQHANAFSLRAVDRFYTVQPASGAVRGWVGHRRDWKWFFAVNGRFTIGLIEPDDWTEPSHSLAPTCFDLAEGHPAVLEVPPGFMTAARAEMSGSLLLVFSSGRIEDAPSDDFRQPADRWMLPSMVLKR